jgi:hypothetical protein
MRYADKGYKVPEINDTDFWNSIVFDIQRLNDHTHDDVDSQRLTPGAAEPYKVTIGTADWVGASAPYYYDFTFPLTWNVTWADNDPCPVTVTARNTSEDIVYLTQARGASGLGVRLYTYVKLDIVLGVT